MTRSQSQSPSSTSGVAPRGWVSFVGSGPGDPGLLTVRAVELIRDADVIVTESPDHVDMVRTLLGLPAPVEGEEPAGPLLVDGGFGEDGAAADARGAREGRGQARQEAARRTPHDG